jgi:hypothetical protein
VIREDIWAAGRVPLIEHNPGKGDKREFAQHEAQRYKTHSGIWCLPCPSAWIRQGDVPLDAVGVVALCADQFTRLLM